MSAEHRSLSREAITERLGMDKELQRHINFFMELHYMRQLHERTRNPWHAYQLCRRAERPAPPWVLEYFDKCAAGLFKLAHNVPKTIGPAVANAIGIPCGKGKPNVFKQVHDATHISIASAVAAHRATGSKLGDALLDVAMEFDVDEKTVRRALRRYDFKISDETLNAVVAEVVEARWGKAKDTK